MTETVIGINQTSYELFSNLANELRDSELVGEQKINETNIPSFNGYALQWT